MFKGKVKGAGKQPQPKGGLVKATFTKPQPKGGLVKGGFAQPQPKGGVVKGGFAQPQPKGGVVKGTFAKGGVVKGGVAKGGFASPAVKGPSKGLAAGYGKGVGVVAASFGKGKGKDMTKGGKDGKFGKGPPSFSKGFDKGGKDKGKGKKGKKPGHLLPRTRISEAPFTGTVAEWKGKYGWIEPGETIEHEKAGKHQGRLFFGMDDIIGGEEPVAGANVQFHIWEDVSGLGADEVTVC